MVSVCIHMTIISVRVHKDGGVLAVVILLNATQTRTDL